MQETPQRSASAFVKITGKPCTAAVSSIIARRARGTLTVVVSRFEGQKGAIADSESQILAMKIFS
jgi:hypothetical protein